MYVLALWPVLIFRSFVLIHAYVQLFDADGGHKYDRRLCIMYSTYVACPIGVFGSVYEVVLIWDRLGYGLSVWLEK